MEESNNYNVDVVIEKGIRVYRIVQGSEEIEKFYAVRTSRVWVLMRKETGKDPMPIRTIGFSMDTNPVFPDVQLREEADKRVKELEKLLNPRT
jgi:hypothetical protein